MSEISKPPTASAKLELQTTSARDEEFQAIQVHGRTPPDRPVSNSGRHVRDEMIPPAMSTYSEIRAIPTTVMHVLVHIFGNPPVGRPGLGKDKRRQPRAARSSNTGQNKQWERRLSTYSALVKRQMDIRPCTPQFRVGDSAWHPPSGTQGLAGSWPEPIRESGCGHGARIGNSGAGLDEDRATAGPAT
ncbi:hypothetical protein E4U54_007067 [Claviceps lovelessii]|nr:hypothetical protein E4U54_007067 [Claviceps lovelessii]